jgi:metal-responsive CopG/Arc/MetJ family transcriptional regulator
MISITGEMYRHIEDFRFNNRYPTRSEATAELLRLGFLYLKKQKNVAEDDNLCKPLKIETSDP